LLCFQGDKEAELGLPFSPLCDRKSTMVAQSQIGEWLLQLHLHHLQHSQVTLEKEAFYKINILHGKEFCEKGGQNGDWWVIMQNTCRYLFLVRRAVPDSEAKALITFYTGGYYIC